MTKICPECKQYTFESDITDEGVIYTCDNCGYEEIKYFENEESEE